MTDTKYFCVTSHGWSGSFWLALALDSHPEILCTHSALNIPARMDSSKETLKKKKREHAAAVNGRINYSIEGLFDEIRSYSDHRYPVYGCVHTLRIRDLPEIYEKSNNDLKHRVVNLVRNPISVISSGHGQLYDHMQWDVTVLQDVVNSISTELDFFNELAVKHNLNLCDQDVLAFLSATMHMHNLKRDQDIAPECPTVRMEDITGDKQQFKNLVGDLTENSIDVGEDYVDAVFSRGPINKHSKGSRLSTPEEKYNFWDEWKKEAFIYAFERTGLRDSYGRFGYDFSFI